MRECRGGGVLSGICGVSRSIASAATRLSALRRRAGARQRSLCTLAQPRRPRCPNLGPRSRVAGRKWCCRDASSFTATRRPRSFRIAAGQLRYRPLSLADHELCRHCLRRLFWLKLAHARWSALPRAIEAPRAATALAIRVYSVEGRVRLSPSAGSPSSSTQQRASKAPGPR